MTSTPEGLTMPTRRPEFNEAWGERFTHAMRAHQEHLQRIVDADNELLMDEDTEPVDDTTFTGQPFDGCQDCWEREMWSLAIALTLQGQENGEVWLEEPEQCTGAIHSQSPPPERCTLIAGHEGPCQ